MGRACLVVAAASLSFTVLETVSCLRDLDATTITQENRSTPGYYEPDEVLGYAPATAAVAREIRRRGRETLFDVTYTVGDNRLRISPGTHSMDPNDCALFFGDSFTFGEGVNDSDAMPYIVGELSGDRVYNFGFHGYGPHQMLASIQSGAVERTVECRPRAVIYQAIVEHAWRAAGNAPWDAHGPQYLMTRDGLTYAGHFDDTRLQRLRRRARAQLTKSHAYRRYVASLVPDDDITRFVKIVDSARTALAAAYPSAAFHVVFWDPVPDDNVLRKELDGLRSKGIAIHLVSDILPRFAADRLPYELSPYDEHPNALAHRLIARYIVTRILTSSTSVMCCSPSPAADLP